MSIIKISKEIWTSFLKFVLLTALIHIGVLIISAIKNGNIKYLNYFKILGLNNFWPNITNGRISDIISVLIMSAIVIGFYLIKISSK
ncbi:MAG: hypothetical protein WC895_02310 [Candidatus Shapirobacteria bacterium]|jgi:hypothetical protein